MNEMEKVTQNWHPEGPGENPWTGFFTPKGCRNILIGCGLVFLATAICIGVSILAGLANY